MTLGYRIRIELLEDGRVGTGTGGADIDAFQARDARGLPAIPGTHLRGVLRALAAEFVSTDMPEGSPAICTREDMDRIFGARGGKAGALSITTAFLAAGGAGDTVVWGSTALDPATGGALESSLRFEEFAPAGSVFEALASLADDTLDRPFRALVERMDRIGGRRNRGGGLVRVSIETNTPEVPESCSPGRPGEVCRLTISAVEPLCLAATGQPDNVIRSESFVRGQTLKGAMVRWAIDRRDDALADDLLEGRISVGDALPLPAAFGDGILDGVEVVPMPLNIGTPKAAGPAGSAPWPWWADDDAAGPLGRRGEREFPWPAHATPGADAGASPGKLKRPGPHEYLARQAPDAAWRRFAQPLATRLRTRVPDPAAGIEQGLFSNDEIPEGTRFLAEIRVGDPRARERLDAALRRMAGEGGWLRIGRGGRPAALREFGWFADPPRPPGDAGDRMTVLLASDLVARDECLNFETVLTPRVLGRLAGISVDEGSLAWDQRSETVEIRGFNAMSGLPRAARLGIRRGSVATLVAGDEGARQALRALRGALAALPALGEGQDEGLGRFRLDFGSLRPDRGAEISPGVAAAPDARERLLGDARRIAGQLHGPSASQWGEFRARALVAETGADVQALFAWAEQSAGRVGGAGWKAVCGSKPWKDLRDRCVEASPAEAGRLVDAVVRWRRADGDGAGEGNAP